MKIESIEKLCCPMDKADLELNIISKDLQGAVLEGYLHCSECNRLYPIVQGIPIMNPDEYREPALEQALFEKWKNHLKAKEVVNFRLVGKQ